MNGEQQRLRERQFVEQVGLLFEQLGGTRMDGRVMGWLLICDPPRQSAGELAEALMASKGSISTATRQLVQMGVVERLSLPGQRRDYFIIKRDGMDKLIYKRLAVMTEFRRLFEQGMELLRGKNPELRKRLEIIHGMYAFFEREMPALMERWERERNRLAASGREG